MRRPRGWGYIFSKTSGEIKIAESLSPLYLTRTPYACRENRSLAFFRSKLCEPAQAAWQPKSQNSFDRIDTITKPKDLWVLKAQGLRSPFFSHKKMLALLEKKIERYTTLHHTRLFRLDVDWEKLKGWIGEDLIPLMPCSVARELR